MIHVPNHPYAQYQTGYDQRGQFWISCACSFCGGSWKKPCNQPERANKHIYNFALQHAHGLRPTVNGR